MNSKYRVGDSVVYKNEEYQIMSIQGVSFIGGELISYRLAGIEGWIYEESISGSEIESSILDTGMEVTV